MSTLLVALAILAVIAAWRARARRRLHHHRIRHLRLRLHLRLHPGRGHATGLELWLRWGRLASFRESKRTRPSLGFWYRLTHPSAHSFFVGRAHHHRTARISVQEHGCLIGPRSYKSALLSRIIMDAPGAVVSTSSKPDMYALTAAVRCRRGPVWVFNPQDIGGIPSTVRWSPLEGCEDPATAIRRGAAFAGATSTEGTEDSGYWRRQAGAHLQNLFGAAALARQNMRKVGRWVGSAATTAEAVAILEASGREEWSAKLAELNGPAEKTGATIRSVMSSALSFLDDPALAASVLPAAGEAFDIDHFLLARGTLFMIARGDEQDSTLAPLFAALASEIQHRATQLAAHMPGGRLDPPLTMALDEVTQICPVPLPAWLADSGGQGICVWTAFHGYAQLRARWRDAGAQTVIDCSNVKVVMPGLGDADTLRHLSQLCGQASFREPDSDRTAWHDKLTMDMIRQLPAGFALLIRGGHSPVVVRVARGWKHPEYRRLRRAGLAIVTPAQPEPAAEPAPVLTAAGGRTHDPAAEELATVLHGPWEAQ